jgi:peptidoglycan-associated lipoprotein
MRRTLIMISVFCILVLVSGCSTSKVAKAPDQAGEQIATSADKKDKDDTGGSDRDRITERRLPSDEIPAYIKELQSKIKDIHFDFDKYDIMEADRPTLQEIAAILKKHKSLRIIIEGHADDRGTNEYNLGLGDRRAQGAKAYLMSLGVTSQRVDTVSYGEEKPLCTEQTEDCWGRNRRAHFVLAEGGRL